MPETNDWFYNLLSRGGGYLDPVLKQHIETKPVFPARTDVPDMPWKSHPVNGFLMGNVFDATGKTYDHVKVLVDSWDELPYQPSNIGDYVFHREIYTDGSGWFGLAELPPGYYQFTIDIKDVGKQQIVTWIQPGRVSEVNFNILKNG
jgi:hypothetical protein